MARRTRTRTSRNARRAPETRSWGTPSPRRKEGPSKGQLAAEAALASIVALFEDEDPDTLPAAIAPTVLARLAGTSPQGYWSIGNQILCWLEGSHDTRGYRQWQEAGRHVVKGAKAIRILAPITRTFTETDAETGEKSARKVACGFKAIPVFRIQDTEGLPVEVPDYEPNELPPLAEVAATLGVPVRYMPHDGSNALGHYDPRADAIGLMSHDERVFWHELGHAAHYRACPDVKPGEEQRARKEIVAELVAATIGRLYGREGFLATSRDYIASYGGENPGRAAMKVLADVQAALKVLTDAAERAEHERLGRAMYGDTADAESLAA
jgi:antirestriction protein ArdC